MLCPHPQGDIQAPAGTQQVLTLTEFEFQVQPGI